MGDGPRKIRRELRGLLNKDWERDS